MLKGQVAPHGDRSQTPSVHSSPHVQMSMLKTGTGSFPFRYITAGTEHRVRSQTPFVHSLPLVQMSMLKTEQVKFLSGTVRSTG
jgi:hypothetical protein